MQEPSEGDILSQQGENFKPARWDADAFTLLFMSHSPGLCRYLRGMVRYPEDGNDLAQEVFIKAWLALPQLKDASKFKPWLYVIANHVLADYRRAPKQQRRFSQFSLENRLDEYEKLADHRRPFDEYIAEGELIREALRRLPEKERMCLLLEIEGKFSYAEIAELMSIHPSSVRTYISNARKHCREYRHLHDEGGNNHAR